MLKMLIAEPQQELSAVWSSFFQKQRYVVDVVDHGRQINRHLVAHQYDVIILSAELPGINVFEFCQTYRQMGGQSPIIGLGMSSSSDELERFLEAGADAYSSERIKLQELSARIRALLRRRHRSAEKMLTIKGVALERSAGTVHVGTAIVHLYPIELDLLEFLMRNSGSTFTAQALLERVWRSRPGSSVETVRTHIKSIRKKLSRCGQSNFIQTVRMQGYTVGN